VVPLPPPDAEMLEDLRVRRESVFRGAVAVTASALGVWGINIVGAIYWPSPWFGLGVVSALTCVLVTIFTMTLWRLHRRLRLQMTGRIFIIVAEPFGVLIVEGPAKEGRKWKVTQQRPLKWWNPMVTLMDPTGRGPTISKALLDLWVSQEPDMKGIPQKAFDELTDNLEVELQKTFVPSVEDSSQERVE